METSPATSDRGLSQCLINLAKKRRIARESNHWLDSDYLKEAILNHGNWWDSIIVEDNKNHESYTIHDNSKFYSFTVSGSGDPKVVHTHS